MTQHTALLAATEVRTLSPAPGTRPSGLRARVRLFRPDGRSAGDGTRLRLQIFTTDQFPLPRRGELLRLPDGTARLVLASEETLADGLWELVAYI